MFTIYKCIFLQKIGVTINVMDIESGDACGYDYLKITYGTLNEYLYCGTMDDVPDNIKYVESTGTSDSFT